MQVVHKMLLLRSGEVADFSTNLKFEQDNKLVGRDKRGGEGVAVSLMKTNSIDYFYDPRF